MKIGGNGRYFHANCNVQLRVLHAGDGFIDGDWWTLARVVSPYWALYRNRHAGAELDLADGTVLALDPQAAWLLPPWMGYGRRTSRVGHLWLHFDVSGLSPAALGGLFRAPVRLSVGRQFAASCTALRRALVARQSDALAVVIAAQSLAWAGFTQALATLSDTDRRRLVPGSGHGRLQPAFQHLSNHLGKPLYNDDLARRCGMGVQHFCRLFRAATGLSPMQYVIDRRIALASELLQAGDLPIEAVASACGFADRYAFTHVFTRRIGRSPAVYRDSLARQGEDSAHA